MKLRSPRSISGKLTRMNLLVSGTALLLAYISFLAYDLVTLRANLITAVETEAVIVGSNSVAALLFDDPQTAENTLSALHGSPHVLAGVILGSDEKPFAQYSQNGSSSVPAAPRLRPGQARGYWMKGTNILVGRRILQSGKSIGSVYLLAATICPIEPSSSASSPRESCSCACSSRSSPPAPSAT